jgi:hypothetical protein
MDFYRSSSGTSARELENSCPYVRTMVVLSLLKCFVIQTSVGDSSFYAIINETDGAVSKQRTETTLP